MHLARRLLGWAIFLGCLAALGTVVFGFVRYRPRCTVIAPARTWVLSTDAALLLTVGAVNGKNTAVRVWDTANGSLVHERVYDAGQKRCWESPDRRRVAIELQDGVLRLVDWHTLDEWRFAEPFVVSGVEFSPKGRWLIVRTSQGEPNFVIDVAARKIAARLRDGWPSFRADETVMLDHRGPDRHLTMSEMASGKVLGVLPLKSNFAISPDGRLLIELHSEPVPEPKWPLGAGPFNIQEDKRERKDYRIDVWDLASSRHRFHHEMKRAGNLAQTFSPDGRYLALRLWQDKVQSNLEMIDTSTGKTAWTYAMKAGYSCSFSADGSLCMFFHGDVQDGLTMFDTASGRVLWEKPTFFNASFAPGTGILLCQDDRETPQQFLNAATGELLATAPVDFRTSNHIPWFTPDGRHFAIGGWSRRVREPHFWETWLEKRWPALFGSDGRGVSVMESATGRELFRAGNCGEGGNSLADDAGTLVTAGATADLDEPRVLDVWEVRPGKAWGWAVGAGLCAGLVWHFGVKRLISALKQRKPASKSAIPA